MSALLSFLKVDFELPIVFEGWQPTVENTEPRLFFARSSAWPFLRVCPSVSSERASIRIRRLVVRSKREKLRAY